VRYLFNRRRSRSACFGIAVTWDGMETFFAAAGLSASCDEGAPGPIFVSSDIVGWGEKLKSVEVQLAPDF
jgi:hypothetical protein